MNHIFQPILRKGVLLYFDDILIYIKGWTTHISYLKRVLKISKENNFYAKQSKCDFAKNKIQFLGFIVSQDGVCLDPRKVKAIESGKHHPTYISFAPS